MSKYEQVACWLKQKQSVENPELLDKDELGQTLIPDDIILGEETRFFALSFPQLTLILSRLNLQPTFW